jgi:hypothetical protein
MFKPGQSGNLAGQSKNTPEQLEERRKKAALKKVTEEYRATLAASLPQFAEIIKKMALNEDLGAIKEINDRVMGKAKQDVDITSDGEKIEFNVVNYKDEPIEQDNGDTNSTQLQSEELPASDTESAG